jgi:hypothetical protein
MAAFYLGFMHSADRPRAELDSDTRPTDAETETRAGRRKIFEMAFEAMWSLVYPRENPGWSRLSALLKATLVLVREGGGRPHVRALAAALSAFCAAQSSRMAEVAAFKASETAVPSPRLISPAETPRKLRGPGSNVAWQLRRWPAGSVTRASRAVPPLTPGAFRAGPLPSATL